MPITEIINEIDMYLTCLRQAKELLSDQRTEAPPKRVPRRKKKANPKRADQASSRRHRSSKNKSQANHLVAHLTKSTERVDVSAKFPSPVVQQVAHSERPAIT